MTPSPSRASYTDLAIGFVFIIVGIPLLLVLHASPGGPSDVIGPGAVITGQERVDLTTPVTPPTLSNYHLERLIIDVDLCVISAQLKGTNGEALVKIYNSTTVPTCATLLTQLNKANFSGGNPSLIRVIYNRLITDGVIVGTVSGVPQ